jgi:pyruvate/2-oxoglutarate dehydrogenase complex dihydrolipoamide dehydrogenase (E3) component
MVTDFVVIGGGQGGIPLAHALASAGIRTVLVESKDLGGSCINYGCTPTKAAIASARLAALARRACDFGLDIPEVKVDFERVIEQAAAMALRSREGLDAGFENVPSLTLVRGQARLSGRNHRGHYQIMIDGRETVGARQVVINVGSRSVIPDIPGMDSARVLCSENWLELTDLPEHLVMIGSGYIGVEMGQFYRRMGARVTMVEHGGQILSHEDPDVAEAVEVILKREGIQFLKNSEVRKIEWETSGDARLRVNDRELMASHVFAATGREGATEDLGLETIGLKADAHGFIPCSDRLETEAAGVWVCGDARGGPLFTHTSWDDYRILESQLLGDKSRTLDRIVPYAVFSDPELGRVGLSEKQARRAGRPVRVAKFRFSDNGKANEIREAEGFIKLIADAKEDVLLGAAILGPAASELIHIYVTLMNAKAPYSAIRDAIYIHPTLAEAAQSAVAAFGERRWSKKGVGA